MPSVIIPDFNALAGSISRAAEVVLFLEPDFGGQQLRTNVGLNFPVDDIWNDSISSIIVVSGTWRFFAASWLSGQSADRGPGYYRNSSEFGLPYDSISSIQMIGY